MNGGTVNGGAINGANGRRSGGVFAGVSIRIRAKSLRAPDVSVHVDTMPVRIRLNRGTPLRPAFAAFGGIASSRSRYALIVDGARFSVIPAKASGMPLLIDMAVFGGVSAQVFAGGTSVLPVALRLSTDKRRAPYPVAMPQASSRARMRARYDVEFSRRCPAFVATAGDGGDVYHYWRQP